jgi:hypothetical protein
MRQDAIRCGGDEPLPLPMAVRRRGLFGTASAQGAYGAVLLPSPDTHPCARHNPECAQTDNRSLPGTLNDFCFMLKWPSRDEPAADLVQAALDLSRTSVRPLGPGFPDMVTRSLLA